MDDQIRSDQCRHRLQVLAENLGRDGERQVAEDPMSGARILEPTDVRVNDVHVVPSLETMLHLPGEHGIDFNRDDVTGSDSEGLCQASPAGPDLDDEVGVSDLGLLDELSGDPVASKEVLAARCFLRRPVPRRDHGGSP